jgi:hypothetical protein
MKQVEHSMINSIPKGFSIHSNPVRQRLVLLSPFVVILLEQLAARTLGPAMGVWSWVPLNMGYWTTIALLIAWAGGRQAILRWLSPSRGNWI